MNKKASIGLNVLSPFKNSLSFKQNISSPGLTQTSNFEFPFRSFGLTFSYSFGKTTFGAPKAAKGVNNDDLKQGDSQQGDMPGGGQGAGGQGGAGSGRPRQ